MREAKDSGEVVGARLRAVLPGGAAPRAVERGPLNWSDIVPGWAEEELDPFAVPATGGGAVAGGVSAGSSGGLPPAGLAGGTTGRSPVEFPRGSAWAGGPPGSTEPPGFPWDSVRRSPGSPVVPEPEVASPGVDESLFPGGDETFYDRAMALACQPAGPGVPVTSPSRPSSPEPFRPSSPESSRPSSPVPPGAQRAGFDDAGSAGGERVRLDGAGAFGGDRRAWLHAFDPGRPGVRALAAVAVVVVLVAGFLAWRARPRVDDVEPSFGGPGTTSAVSAPGPGAGAPNPGAAAGVPAPAAGEVVVAVGGKVRKPGLVRLAPGARVADALTAAGGAQPGVDVAVLNLARHVTDGELIMVGVTPPPGAPAPNAGGTPGAVPSGAAGPLINLNTATTAVLDGLPGVGPVLAQRILDARDAQGGFRAVTDLRKVDGIGDARYEQLKDLVTV